MVEATTISVDDITASSLPVKVVDRKGKPITGQTFAVIVDNKRENTRDTDTEGRMKIATPRSIVKFTLKTPLEEGIESGTGTQATDSEKQSE